MGSIPRDLMSFAPRDREIIGSVLNKGHRTRQTRITAALFWVGNMLIPISSGVQQGTSHTTSPHESHGRERVWKYETKEKIVDDSNLSAGCGGPVVSLFPNYQHLVRQHSQQEQETKKANREFFFQKIK